MNAVDLAARETFLADVLTTAIEELSIGHWAEVLEYRWYDADLRDGPQGDGEPAPNGGSHVYARLLMPNEDGLVVEVSNQILSDAFREVLLRDDYRSSGWLVETPYGLGFLPTDAWRDRVLQHRRDNDASDINPGDADMLVQLALWGCVVF